MVTIRVVICTLLVTTVLCQHFTHKRHSRFAPAMGSTAIAGSSQSASESVSESHSRVESKSSKQSSKQSSSVHADINKNSEMINLQQEIAAWQNARNSDSSSNTGSQISSQIGRRQQIHGPLTASLSSASGSHGRNRLEGRVASSPIVTMLKDVSQQGRVAVNDASGQAGNIITSADKEADMLTNFLASKFSDAPRRNHLKTSVSSIQRGAQELGELWEKKGINMLGSSSSHSSESSSASSSSSSSSSQSSRQNAGTSGSSHFTPNLPVVPNTVHSSVSDDQTSIIANNAMSAVLTGNVNRNPSRIHTGTISRIETGTRAGKLDSSMLENLLDLQQDSASVNQIGNGITRTVITSQPRVLNTVLSNRAGNQKAFDQGSVNSRKTSISIPLLERRQPYQNPQAAIPQPRLTQTGSSIILQNQNSGHGIGSSSKVLQNQNSGHDLSQHRLSQSVFSNVLQNQNSGHGTSQHRLSQSGSSSNVLQNQNSGHGIGSSSKVLQNQNSGHGLSQHRLSQSGSSSKVLQNQNSGQMVNAADMQNMLSSLSQQSGIAAISGGQAPASNGSRSYSFWYKTSSGTPGLVKVQRSRFSSGLGSGRSGNSGNRFGNTGSGKSSNSWSSSWSSSPSSGAQGSIKDLKTMRSLGQVLRRAGQSGNGKEKSGSSSSWSVSSRGTPSYSWSWSTKHGSTLPNGLKGTGHGTNTGKSGVSGSFRSWRQKSVSGSPDIENILKAVLPPISQTHLSAGGNKVQSHASESTMMESSSSHEGQSQGQSQTFSSNSNTAGGCCT